MEIEKETGMGINTRKCLWKGDAEGYFHRSFINAEYLIISFLSIMILFLNFPVTAFSGETTIRIEESSGLDRTAWPVGLGFPFQKGELKDTSSLAVFCP